MPLSLLIPCYNEAASIPALYECLVKVLAGVTEYELLFVDEGSRKKFLVPGCGFYKNNLKH